MTYVFTINEFCYVTETYTDMDILMGHEAYKALVEPKNKSGLFET